MNLANFILKFLKKQPLAFAGILLFSLIWVFDLLFWPFLLKKIVDCFTQYDASRLLAWPSLKILLILSGCTLILIEGCFRFRDFLTAVTFPKMEAKIRMALFDHVQRHSPKYFNDHFSGSLANKISDLVLMVTDILKLALEVFAPAFLTCLLTLVIFSKINLFFGYLTGVWLAFHLILSWLFTRKCAHYSYLHGKSRSTLVGKIVDSFTNNFAVNLFYRFNFEKSHIERYQKIEKKANRKAQIYSVKMFTCLSISFALQVFALMVGMIFYWVHGNISTGEVIQLFLTMWNLSFVIWLISSEAPELFKSYGIAKQALSIMEAPQDILDSSGANDLSIKHGKISFQNVSFAYGNNQIFQNKNLEIKAGEKVGLVGFSGAGKSTFVNLILRFFSLNEGAILIDGQDISKASLESLRKSISLIPQDPILFHRSLEENIRYGKLDASKEEVIEAAKLAHCDEFINQCSAGYSTLVGERGTKLSGGEKQRIAIARAMLLKAPILLLDEATSALDSVTESYIQESLDLLMNNRTTIIVAHRLSTLSKMDRILVFDHGKGIEEGSHVNLLKLNGHYAKMWHMQAGGFLPESAQ